MPYLLVSTQIRMVSPPRRCPAPPGAAGLGGSAWGEGRQRGGRWKWGDGNGVMDIGVMEMEEMEMEEMG